MNVKLPPYLERIARDELGETPESRRECIPKLQQLLEDKREDFDKIRVIDDAFLLRFLRVSKFNVDKAYNRVIVYYEARKKYEEDYKLMKMQEILPFLEFQMSCVLPEKTKNHETIFYSSFSNFDPKLYTMEQLYRAIIFGMESIIDQDEELQIVGCKCIINCTNFGSRHFVQCTPPYCYKLAMHTLKVMPIRIRSLHYVNEPRLFRIAFKILYTFIPAKIKERIHIHGSDLKSLHEQIDPKLLPVELDGTGKNFKVQDWADKCLHYFSKDLDAFWKSSNGRLPEETSDTLSIEYWVRKYYFLFERYQAARNVK